MLTDAFLSLGRVFVYRARSHGREHNDIQPQHDERTGRSAMVKGGTGIGGGTSHPDYAALELPDDEPFTEWSWQHRRAYVFNEWVGAGTHGLLNKSALADQFDVSRHTIYSDLDAVAEFVDQHLGDRHGAETVNVYKKAVRELLSDGDYKDAARVQSMMGDWLERRGAVDKEPEKVEVDHGVGEEDLEFLDEVF